MGIEVRPTDLLETHDIFVKTNRSTHIRNKNSNVVDRLDVLG